MRKSGKQPVHTWLQCLDNPQLSEPPSRESRLAFEGQGINVAYSKKNEDSRNPEAAGKPANKPNGGKPRQGSRSTKNENRRAHARESGSMVPARARAPRDPSIPRSPDDWSDLSPWGAPRVEVDPGDIYELAKQGITQKSMASLLHISLSTLERNLAAPGAVQDAYQAGLGAIELDIKQEQLKALREAENPPQALMIWLGKNHAGQRDVKAIEFSGPGGGPVEGGIDLRAVIMQRMADWQRAQGGVATIDVEAKS